MTIIVIVLNIMDITMCCCSGYVLSVTMIVSVNMVIMTVTIMINMSMAIVITVATVVRSGASIAGRPLLALPQGPRRKGEQVRPAQRHAPSPCLSGQHRPQVP